MIAGIVLAAALAAAPAADARIVAFTQRGSLAARDFEEKTLPRLRALAAARGIPLEVRDAAAGAPAEVHLTPLLVYQDAQGRSIFRGRYSDVDRFAQFLRTARTAPLADDPVRHERVAAWRRGRTVIVAPIKITALTGTLPPRFEERAFLDRARRAVLAGFTRFGYQAAIETGPSDRAFYMDFHPYRGSDGTLHVSAAIYSGFDCVEPVFVRFDEPVSGPWPSFEEVFRRAGRMLEDEVAQLVVGSRAGDAFDPVPERAPLRTWDALGLVLPRAAVGDGRSPARTAIALGSRWTIEDASADDAPRLAFRFSPPLDSYNGEVRELSGAARLGPNGRLAGATATFEARTASITMGNKTLDAELRDKILRVAAHPTARFTLDPLPESTAPLAYGAPVPFTGTGRFEMLGESVPVRVSAQAEPVVGEDGAPRVVVRATFRIRIADPFGLTGPDGPAPANETVLFDLRFRLRGQLPN